MKLNPGLASILFVIALVFASPAFAQWAVIQKLTGSNTDQRGYRLLRTEKGVVALWNFSFDAPLACKVMDASGKWGATQRFGKGGWGYMQATNMQRTPRFLIQETNDYSQCYLYEYPFNGANFDSQQKTLYQTYQFSWTGAKSAVAPDGTIWWLNADRHNVITLTKLPAGAASTQQYPMPSGFYSNSDNFGYGTMYNSEYDAYGGMMLLPENANSVWLIGREYHQVTDGREQRPNDWSARLFVAMHFQDGAWGPKKFVLPSQWDQTPTNQYDAALNKNGQPVIVFSGLRTRSTTPSKDSVWVTRWNGSAFTAPLSISAASEYARLNPAMTIDDQNRVHVVWSQDRPSQASAIYYARGTTDSFEPPVCISEKPDYPACIPDIETMPNGDPVVIYCQYDGNNMHIYSRRYVTKTSSPLREYAENN